jgi:hypothetical protein
MAQTGWHLARDTCFGGNALYCESHFPSAYTATIESKQKSRLCDDAVEADSFKRTFTNAS